MFHERFSPYSAWPRAVTSCWGRTRSARYTGGLMLSGHGTVAMSSGSVSGLVRNCAQKRNVTSPAFNRSAKSAAREVGLAGGVDGGGAVIVDSSLYFTERSG